eukprot:scaffold129327_cov65-Phaeocystis_antarctica.AAC.7
MDMDMHSYLRYSSMAKLAVTCSLDTARTATRVDPRPASTVAARGRLGHRRRWRLAAWVLADKVDQPRSAAGLDLVVSYDLRDHLTSVEHRAPVGERPQADPEEGVGQVQPVRRQAEVAIARPLTPRRRGGKALPALLALLALLALRALLALLSLLALLALLTAGRGPFRPLLLALLAAVLCALPEPLTERAAPLVVVLIRLEMQVVVEVVSKWARKQESRKVSRATASALSLTYRLTDYFAHSPGSGPPSRCAPRLVRSPGAHRAIGRWLGSGLGLGLGLRSGLGS